MPRHDTETREPSHPTMMSHSNAPSQSRPLDVPRRPLMPGYTPKSTRIAGSAWVPHLPEPSPHAVVEWDSISPLQERLTSPNLSSSFHGSGVGLHDPLTQHSLLNGLMPEPQRPWPDNSPNLWPSSLPLIEEYPLAPSRSGIPAQAQPTSLLGAQRSQLPLPQPSSHITFPLHIHPSYPNVAGRVIQPHHFASSDPTPAARYASMGVASEGPKNMNPMHRRITTNIPHLEVSTSLKEHTRLEAPQSSTSSVSMNSEHRPSLLSLTRPEHSHNPAGITQSEPPKYPQSNGSTFSAHSAVKHDSAWNDNSTLPAGRDAVSSPAYLRVPTASRPDSARLNRVGAKQPSPRSAPPITINGAIMSSHTVQCDPSTWPINRLKGIEPEWNFTRSTEKMKANEYARLVALNDRPLPHKRPRISRTTAPVNETILSNHLRVDTPSSSHSSNPRPQSSLSVYPNGEIPFVAELENADPSERTGAGIPSIDDLLSTRLPAHGIWGPPFGWTSDVTRRPDFPPRPCSGAIALHDAFGSTSSSCLFHGSGVEQPKHFWASQDHRTSIPGRPDYITLRCSESSSSVIPAAIAHILPERSSLELTALLDCNHFLDVEPPDALQASIHFSADQFQGGTLFDSSLPHGISLEEEFFPRPAVELSRSFGPLLPIGPEEIQSKGQPFGFIPPRGSCLKLPATSTTSEPLATRRTAAPEFSNVPTADYSAEALTTSPQDRDQQFAILAERIKRILESQHHQGEATDWCIVYQSLVRRMQVPTRSEIAEAMTLHLSPPIPQGFTDYLKRRISHVLSHNKNVFVKAGGDEKRHGWKVRQ